MARIVPLYSGSSGNATFIGSSKAGILVDVGKSCKKTIGSLADAGISSKAVKAVFITHEHIDHVAGVDVLCRNLKIPVYTSEKVAGALKISPKIKINCIDSPTEMADMLIKPFTTPHDSVHCLGYNITMPSGDRVAITTDLGHVTDEVMENLLGAKAVVIESNYEESLLFANIRYPYPLKQRILSENGHLSNDDCAKILPSLVRSGTTQIVLAHLSRDNNTEYNALISANSSLSLNGMAENEDYIIKVAQRDMPTKAVVF